MAKGSQAPKCKQCGERHYLTQPHGAAPKDEAGAMALSEIKLGDRHRKDLGDIEGLVRSIEEVGLLHPVVVKPTGELIAGLRRFEAAKVLGWANVPVHIVDLEDIVRGEGAENAERKDFTLTEGLAIEDAVRPLLETEARERQLAALKQGEESPRSANFAEREKGRAREKAARYTGLSHLTLTKARAVQAAAEEDPERYSELLARMDKTGRVDGAHRELKRLQTWKAKTEIAPPTGLFQTLVIDPPWRYESRADDSTHRAALPYPDMSVEEIIDVESWLKVPLPAAEDCFLWLWTTNAFIRDAFRVVEAWGFAYRTLLTWAKPHFGAGDWLRGQTEHCLLASRGELRPLARDASTLLEAPKGTHSEKPDEFYALVEGLSPAPALDIFGRQARPGWAVWGNEIGFVDTPK